MTFFNKIVPSGVSVSQATLGAPSSIAVDELMPCASITHTGLTVNGSGQLVLSSGYAFILTASFYIEELSGSSSMEASWYDVTNTTEIGTRLSVYLSTSNGSDPRGSCFRALVIPSVSTTIEARITAITGALSDVNTNTLSDYAGTPWYSVLSFTV